MSNHLVQSRYHRFALACLGALLFVFAAMPASASAQVVPGTFRLYLDTNVVTHMARKANGQGTEGEAREDSQYDMVGPAPGLTGFGGVAGVGLGYALSEHVVFDFYSGFQRVRFDATSVSGLEESSDLPPLAQVELRPTVEVAMLKGSRFVPYARLGGSYGVRWLEGESDTHTAIGPVMGVGTHIFAAKRVSVDTGVIFRPLFIASKGEEHLYSARGMENLQLREYALMVNFGGSLWL